MVLKVVGVIVFLAVIGVAGPPQLIQYPPLPVEDIIRHFAEKETEFKAARARYGFRQDLLVEELGKNNDVIGQQRVVTESVPDGSGRNVERIVQAPPNTLQDVQITSRDLEEIRQIHTFPLTRDQVPKYNITYKWKERVDEVDCYVFEVRPKSTPRGQLFFQGLVWVDDVDLVIVKTQGTTVPRQNNQVSPSYVTIREQIDDHWFPTYVRATEIVGSSSARITVRYQNHKQIEPDVKLTFGRNSSSTSGSTAPPRAPAQLTIDLSFEEPSGNNILDAEETGVVRIKLSNSGPGTAYGVQVKAAFEGDSKGISLRVPSKLDSLGPGESRLLDINVSAPEAVPSSQLRLRIDVTEANGFDVDQPAVATFSTRALTPPRLTVADVGINDPSGNGQIELREVVDVTARIRNEGQLTARNVKAFVVPGENVFLSADSKRDFDLTNLGAGEFKDISFSVYTNSRATEIPVTLSLREERPRYNAIVPVPLQLNRPIRRVTELVVEGVDRPSTGELPTPLSVDVDINIPKTGLKNAEAVAVVIGISRYQHRDIASANFATRDSAVFRQYLIDTLGFQPGRIIEIEDDRATQAAFKRVFEEQLANYIIENRSDLFVFYSGHGMPDVTTNDSYLVPYDADPSFIRSTGYKLVELYTRLAALKVRSLTVVIDACFSGASENGSLLQAVSPLVIDYRPVFPDRNNAALFTATSKGQVASWHTEKKHGLFTYYFLRGLRGDADTNQDRAITVGEMEAFLSAKVSQDARVLRGREQIPEIQARDKQRILLKR